jgi:hypothetical protein
MGTIFTMLLLSAQPVAVQPIEWLDEQRVKVSAEIKRPNSPMDHANAQIRLMQLAKKACRKKGKPVSEGTLYLEGNGEEGKARRLLLSAIYVCVAD